MPTPAELSTYTSPEITRASRQQWRTCVVLMESEGVSLQDIARGCCVSVGTVREWWRGTVPPLCRQGHLLDSLPSELAARVASRLLASGNVVTSSGVSHKGSSVTQCALEVGSAVGRLQGALGEAVSPEGPGGRAITPEEAQALKDLISQLEGSARSLRASISAPPVKVVA